MGFSKGHRYSLPIFTWTVQMCLYIKSINSCTKMDPNNKLKGKKLKISYMYITCDFLTMKFIDFYFEDDEK